MRLPSRAGSFMPNSLRFAALALLAACADGSGTGTGPGPSADLTIQATAHTSNPFLGTEGGGPTVACLFTFSLSPTGDAGATATWTGGTLRFFVGADRTTPFHSLDLTQAEMNEAFGSSIRAGIPQSGQLGFVSTVPFGMEGVLRYRVAGSSREGEATAYASCLAPVQEAGTARPTLSNLQVAADPGPLEPGDTFRVTWTAASTTGLWETGIAVEGAFQVLHRVAAAYEKQKTYTAEFVVPRDAALGAEVRITGYAVDLLVREGEPLSRSVGPVTDATAPVLHEVDVSGSPEHGLAGEFAGGDEIWLVIHAQDNAELRWLVYEVGPPGAVVRDSVWLESSQPPPFFAIVPTREEWAGEGQLRVYVRDAAGNASRTVQAAPGALRFYPVRPVQTRSATLPSLPADLAVDGARGRVAVLSAAEQRVYVHSLQTLAALTSVALPGAATQVEMAPDGRVVALIPSPASLALIDLAGGPATRTDVALTAGPMQSAYGFGVTANGKALVLGRRAGGETVVVEYDLATGAQRVRADAPSIPFPDAGVTPSHDGSRLLLGGGCVFRADTDAFGPCASLWSGGQFNGVPFQGSGTGAFWSQGSRVLDASLQPRITLSQGPFNLLSPDDRYAYVPDDDRFLRVRLSDGRVEDGFGKSLSTDSRFTADGSMLVTLESGGANNAQHLLTVIELP